MSNIDQFEEIGEESIPIDELPKETSIGNPWCIWGNKPTPKYSLYDAIMSNTDSCIGDLIIQDNGALIKVVDRKGPIFLYNRHTCLWMELSSIDQFATHLSQILQTAVIDGHFDNKKEKTKHEKIKANYEKDLKLYQLDMEKYASDGSNPISVSLFNTAKEGAIEVQRNIDSAQKNIDDGDIFDKKLITFKWKISNLFGIRSVAHWIANRLANKEDGKLFDSQPGLLPVLGNKVVNLKTKEVTVRTLEHYFTYEIPINYDPTKTDPKVQKFFAELMLEDQFPAETPLVLTSFLQRFIGYSISGSTKEQKMGVLIGDENGSNGKGKFVALMRKVFSPIVKCPDKCVIMGKSTGEAPSPQLHALRNCRIAAISELEKDVAMNESSFKGTTGEDVKASRDPHGGVMEWIPKFVLWVQTNYPPLCSGDGATLRRILLITFAARFVENPTEINHRKIDKEIDLMFNDKDFQEAFLTWAIEGSFQYFKNGLMEPESIIAKNNEYKNSQDTFLAFAHDQILGCTSLSIEQEDGTIVDNKNNIKWYTSSSVHKRYTAFCNSNGIPIRLQIKGSPFGKKLKEYLGGEKGKDITWKDSNGTKYNLILPVEEERDKSLLSF